MVRSWVVPAVWVDEPAIVSLAALAAATVTVSSPPDVELMLPSVAETTAVSAFTSRNPPLLPPLAVATPLAKVMVVGVPKLMAAPLLLLTVGCAPEDAWLAPLKVSALSPV